MAPRSFSPSASVTEQAAALADELTAMLGSLGAPAAAGPAAPPAPDRGPGQDEEARAGGLPCPAQPAEFLADVLEAAAVGLRAFSAHLTQLRHPGSPAPGEPADRPAGEPPGESPSVPQGEPAGEEN